MNVPHPSNDTPGTEAAAPTPPQAAEGPPPTTANQAPAENWGPGYYTPKPAIVGPRPKSPAMACILSAVPGLGQIYVGHYGLGFLHAIVASAVFTMLVSNPDSDVLPFGVIFFIFFMLYNIVDAGRRAALYNLAIAGVPGVELPRQMKLPQPGGTIFGGVVFIVVGFILLMNTRFDASLEWVGEWWPVAPMIFGGYLIARAIQERAAKE